MKSRFIFLVISLILPLCLVSGQSFDWNLRGGINIQDSKTPDKDVSVLYHAGVQAGIRITSWGFYGEALLSLQENQYGGDPLAYFTPAILMRGYPRKIFFAEMGASLFAKTGDSGVSNDILNPDGDILFFAGLGLNISKLEISFRSHLKQSYPMMRVTAAIKF